MGNNSSREPSATGTGGGLRDIWAYTRGARVRLSACLVLGLLSQLVLLLQPVAASSLISSVEAGRRLMPSLVFLLGLALANAGLVMIQQLVTGKLGESMVAAIRQSLLQTFFAMPILARERQAPGWYGARIANDPPLIRNAVSGSVLQGIQAALLMVGSGVALSTIDGITFLTGLGFAVAAIIVISISSRPIRRNREKIQEENAQLSIGVQRSAEAARLLAAYQAEGTRKQELLQHILAARKAGVKVNRLYSYLGSVSSLVMQLAFGSAVVVGGYRVAAGDLGFPDLIAFLMYFSMFSSSISSISGVTMGIQEALAGSSRINEFRDFMLLEKPDSQDERAEVERLTPGTQAQVPQPGAAVELRDIWFRYPDEDWALQGISFTAPAGKTTVLVGPSGGGKSTILGLIEGFFTPQRGSVIVGGANVAARTVRRVRDTIGFVDQGATVLPGTIRENLLLARPSASDEEMARVLWAVGLGAYCSEGSEGLKSTVGDGGISLSGGQRQRLAIARALLKETSVMLLDEPTSSLDGISETEVTSILRGLGSEVTVLISAHRLSTIVEADWVVMIENGCVVEQGTHAQLLDASDAYRSLTMSQRGL